MSVPTNQELEAMSEHVMYEITEFRKSTESLQTLSKTDLEWNRTIESVLLHFRILRGFFLGEGRNEDDVFAWHYIGTENWTPPRVSIFDETKSDLDKQLAHLTLARLKKKPWDTGTMSAAIESLVGRFKESLSGLRANWFSRLEARTVIKVRGKPSNSTETRL